jgi:SAM-dependent methyltransferase
MITRRAGLSQQVSFRQGDMTAMPFDNDVFDGVFSLHAIMNVEDKEKLFHNILRVLRPGGCFALYEVCQGTVSSPYFPVPWAGGPEMSFLLRPEDLHKKLLDLGLQVLVWRDVSGEALRWFHTISEKRAASEKEKKGINREAKKIRPGISLLLGPDAAEKSRNVFRNLSEDRIRTVFGVFRKSD